MLVYNFQKEFIGIDESDLKSLGFENLKQLRAESADFADLFVKTPGFVHNFAHIHWIDYVASASSYEESKAIIHTNDQDYKCNLDVKIIYLVDSPSKKAYLISLLNLRALSSNELEQIKTDIQQKPTPATTQEKQKLFEAQDLDKEPQTIPKIITKTEIKPIIKNEFIPDIIEQNIQPPVVEDSSVDLEIVPEEIFNDTYIKEIPEPFLTPKKENLKRKKPDNIYIYDPQVASDELGLPIDLVKEFLEDFLTQAEEFKDKIYDAIDAQDLKSAKTLAHKLKGVAANLRIEDALEVLTVANISDNLDNIKVNIDKFYTIMSTLSIASSSQTTKEKAVEKTIEDNDDYDESLFINFDDG